MTVETETFLPKGTREKTEIETMQKLFKLVDYAKEHISKTDRLKSVSIKHGNYKLTITPIQ